MRELESEYEGQVTVSIKDANTAEGETAREAYGWQKAFHGLVTLDTSGEYVGDIPGHNYGKDEVRAKFVELLAEK